ncbi:hypothetical protein ACP70R_016181 [Stipagrostis hirtigluma subsp. patula]
MVMWPVLNPTTFDGDPVGSKYDSWAPTAPDTISNAGCTFMDLANSANKGSISVVVESSDVNSVIIPLTVQATGTMTTVGAPFRNLSPSERMSVRPLDLKPSAMAKPAPSRRMISHWIFLHLFQSISFSSSFFRLGIMNSNVAIMI